MPPSTALVSTQWLADHRADAGLCLFDASYHMAASGRDAAAEYLAGHIAGARRFDIERICDHANPVPHMAPAPDDFAAAVATLGVSGDSCVVAYDAYGMMSAARVWWMFRLFGHDTVFVLDGGLPKWLAEGRATVSGPEEPAAMGRFTARYRPELVCNQQEVVESLRQKTRQLVDARSARRFQGLEAEPRPGLRSGHMPDSRSLPYTEMLDPQSRTLLSPATIEQRFAAAGVDLGQPVTVSCGSGVTACVLALALFQARGLSVPVYDGSWTEWALNEALPVQKAS